MFRKKNNHQWDFMGFDTETNKQYSYCDCCKKLTTSDNIDSNQHLINPKLIISSKDYDDRVKRGLIRGI